MGGKGSRQYVSPMQNNPNDKIGEIKTIKNGCALLGSEQAYLGDKIPQNGEYEFSGAGNYCHYCSDSPGNLTTSPWCDGTCCPILGGQGQYKRVRYLADTATCCVTGHDTVGNLTCDPADLVIGAPQCDNPMLDYCKDTVLFNDGRCSAWCAQSPTQCLAKKANYCNNSANVGKQECQQFCASNPGQCDTAMDTWCNSPENVHKPICACYDPFLKEEYSAQLKSYNPKCWDRRCETSGYHSTVLMAEACPDTVNCSVYNSIEGSQQRATIVGNTVVQKCGTESEKAKIVTGPDGKLYTAKSWWNDGYVIAEIVTVTVFGLYVLFVSTPDIIQLIRRLRLRR